MYVSRFTRFFLGSVTALMFAFLYSPLVIIVVLSFNTSESLTWPPEGFTLDWWDRALHRLRRTVIGWFTPARAEAQA